MLKIMWLRPRPVMFYVRNYGSMPCPDPSRIHDGGNAMHAPLRTLVLTLTLMAVAGLAFADDRAAILSMLKRYSPDGYFIVDGYAKSGGGTDFMEYWDGSSDDSRLSSYNTIVHEMAHGVMAGMADNDSLLFLASRDERIMVPLTDVFFSREMVPSFPKELRTFRFSTYVDCTEDNLGSQVDGAYGLLDEMDAYFLGTKTSWELLPYFEAQGVKAPWGPFFQSINGTLYGILEFKLYVLKYLMYAQQNKPSVFKGIMANQKFAKAFISVDRASSSFIQDYFTRKLQVYASLRKQGLDIKEEGDYLMIGAGGQCSGTFMDVYTLLAKELQKDAYQSLMRQLNAGAAVAASPVTGGGGSTGAAASGAAETAPTTTVTTSSITTGGAAAGTTATAEGEEAAPVQQEQQASALGVIERMHGAGGAAATLSRGGGDAVGDAGVDFIDISRADVRLYPDMLAVGISYVAFPGKLLFNNPNLKENGLEYEWSCDIDLEGDGKPDYSISMSSFKAPGAQPIEASVTLFCQADLWKLTASGGEAVEGKVKVETDGSALFFSLADGEALPLSRITRKTKFTVNGYYGNGKNVVMDSLEL
jgi:hypothetical protein